jgi:hypothetical protein
VLQEQPQLVARHQRGEVGHAPVEHLQQAVLGLLAAAGVVQLGEVGQDADELDALLAGRHHLAHRQMHRDGPPRRCRACTSRPMPITLGGRP